MLGPFGIDCIESEICPQKFQALYSLREEARWLMMSVCVFCFAVWADGATASLNLNLDFRRDASNCGFILSASSPVYTQTDAEKLRIHSCRT